MAYDSEIVLTDAINLQTKHTIESVHNVTALALSIDGRLLAAASNDGSIKIWTAGDGVVKQNFETGGPVTALQFATQDQFLAVGRKDGNVSVWNLQTGQLVFEGKSSLEVLMHHARTPPTPPSQRTELPLPESLDRLILSCLEKDPARRPQSAVALSRKLSACAAELAWTEERAAQWWQRHRPIPEVA